MTTTLTPRSYLTWFLSLWRKWSTVPHLPKCACRRIIWGWYWKRKWRPEEIEKKLINLDDSFHTSLWGGLINRGWLKDPPREPEVLNGEPRTRGVVCEDLCWSFRDVGRRQFDGDGRNGVEFLVFRWLVSISWRLWQFECCYPLSLR